MWKALIDAGVAGAAYWAAWTLRFGARGPNVPAFLPSIFAVTVASQLVAAILVGTYRSRPIPSAIRRFLLGTLIGTGIACATTIVLYGRPAVPISVLGLDAILLAMGGTLWRCGHAAAVLNRRASLRAAETPEGMFEIGPRPLLRSLADLLSYRSLVSGLVARDLKLKYRGSVLGFFWSLLNPLVMVALYTVVFTFLIPNPQPGFVIRLLVGLLAWGLFANSATLATGTVVESGGLLKSVSFPRAILPLSTVLFNLALYLLTLSVFVPILFLYYRIVPTIAMLAFPVMLALQLVFIIGIAFALSSATAVFRDLKHLTEIALAILFWLTPIIYSLDVMPRGVRAALLLSPMSPFIVAYQQLFFDQRWPDPQLWALAAFFACTSMLIGATLFSSLEPRFGEQV